MHFSFGEKQILETRWIKQHAFLVDHLRDLSGFSSAHTFDVFWPPNGEAPNQEKGIEIKVPRRSRVEILIPRTSQKGPFRPKWRPKRRAIPSFERRKGPKVSQPPCTNLTVSLSCPINIVEHWQENDPISEFFRINVPFLQIILDLLKNLQWCKSWKKHSTRIQLLLHWFPVILKRSGHLNLLHLTFPSCNCFFLKWHLHPTQRSPRRHVLLLCLLNHLIMIQCRSRPWVICTFNRVHIQNFFRVLQYQFLCDIESTLNFLEVRILVDLQDRQVIRAKMNGGFHWRRHERPHIKTLVFIASIANVEQPAVIPNFFCENWKTFVKYWWFEIIMLLNSVFVFTASTSFFELVEFEDSSLSLVSKSLHVECFPVTSLENIRLDLGFGLSAPVSWSWSDRLVLHRPSPDWLDLSDLAEGSSSHSTGCATPDSQFSTSPPLASVSPSVNLHWKSLLASLWHGTLFPDRIWKKIAKMAARGHREIRHVEQTETRLEKNVCLRVRSPHLTIDQHLGCSFLRLRFQRRSLLAFLSWRYCSSGLLSRTSFLELVQLVF